MTVLTDPKPLLSLASRAPRCSKLGPPRFGCKGFRPKLGHLGLLRRRQPIPPAQQWDDIAGKAVDRPEKAVALTIKILGSIGDLAACPPDRPAVGPPAPRIAPAISVPVSSRPCGLRPPWIRACPT